MASVPDNTRNNNRNLFRSIKEALGIDPNLPLQKIVIELDCQMVPIVYIKSVVFGEQLGKLGDALAKGLIVDDRSNVIITVEPE